MIHGCMNQQQNDDDHWELPSINYNMHDRDCKYCNELQLPVIALPFVTTNFVILRFDG